VANSQDVLLETLALFFGLSLLSFGGTISLLPDIYRFLVDSRGVMTSTQFANYVALAQAAPGPNILYIALFGFHIAGWWGAVSSLAAISAGPIVLVLAVARVDSALRDHPLRERVLRALAPVSVGLLIVGVWTITKSFKADWRLWVLCAVCVVVFWRTKIHPLPLFALGAIAGAVLGL
jgi:chromate transporter